MLKFRNLKFNLFLVLLGVSLIFIGALKVLRSKNLAEKLGYPRNTKLLIIHADDLGFSNAENNASIKAMEEGSVNSASIIMPGSWVTEMATYANNHKGKHDLGLHLTITSEWGNYKWGSVAPKDKVPTLVNELGYFYKGCPTNASADEIEIELRAQIDLAYAMGIKPTHLDSHMFCLFLTNSNVFEIYLKLAQEYQIPCLVDQSFASLYPNKNTFRQILKEHKVAVVLNQNYTISPENFRKGTDQYYTSVLKSLQPGLSTILIHTAFDNDEMQAITNNQINWGSAWRQADYDFFTSTACEKILEEEQIVLVTWREISKVLTK